VKITQKTTRNNAQMHMKRLIQLVVFASAAAVQAQVQPPIDPYHYTKTASTTYRADGLVETEKVEPDDPKLCVLTTYGYDPAGNRISARQENCPGATGEALFTTRTSTTTYAAQTVTIAGQSIKVPAGSLPSERKNALLHGETQTVDPRFGTVLSKTGPNGLTTRWEYDNFGRATREIHADGTRAITAYCYIAGRVDTATNSSTCPSPGAAEIPADAVKFMHAEPRDASGSEGVKNGPFTRKYLDRAGRVLRQVTEAFDGSTQPGGTNRLIATDTEYGDLGQVLVQTQPYFLDSGSSTSAGSADVGLTRTEYDALGRPVRVYAADNQGSQASVSFGARGSRKARVSSMAYGALVTTTTDDKGNTRREERNVEGRPVRITDAQGAQLVHQHDAFGNLVTTKDALQNTVQIAYDLRGRKLKLTDPDAGMLEYHYDALGQAVWQQNPLQQQRGGSTTMKYDVLGRMTLRSEPEYQSTWTYDNCAMGIGKLCATSASTDTSQQWVYDSLGRLASNRTSVANGPSFASALSYDANGRQATQTWPTGLTVNYGYTPKGFLGNVSLATAVTVNPLPATPGGIPGASMTLPAGTVLWQAQAYNAWDRLEQQKYSNAVVSKSGYEAATGRASSLTTGKANATDVLNHGYVWDSLGRLTNRNDANGDGATGAVTENFEHDALGRLQRYTVAAPAISGLVRTVSLQYNALGSILYKSDVGVYSYGAQGANAVRPHAVQSIEGAAANTYGFDANGNIASATAGKYRGITYTGFNLPDSQSGVQGPAGGSSYVWSYDEDHARIREVRTIPSGTNAGTRTTWYLHPDNTGGLAFESEVNAPTSPSAANPAVTSNRHYLSAGGQSLGVLVTTGALPALGATQTAPPVQSSLSVVKLEYWHKDHLGSIAATTDHNGDVTARDAYDPFGKRRFANGNYDSAGALAIDWNPAVNSGTDRGFTGHEQLDDIGLTHMNGRLYDAVIGRFLSVDKLVGDPADLQAYNRYSYVENSPLVATDPSGWQTYWNSLCKWTPTCDSWAYVVIGNKDKKPDSGASTLPSSTPEQKGSPANSSDKVTGAAAPPPEAKKGGDPRIKELVEISLKRGPDEAKLALAEEYKQRILQVEGKFSRDSTYQALYVDGLQARGMRGGDIASAASSEGAALAIQEGAMASVGVALGKGASTPKAMVQILEREGNVVIASFKVANGEARVAAEVIRDGERLILRGAHIEGDGTLKEALSAAKSFGREQGVKQIIIEGGLRTTGAKPGHLPRPITIDTGL
jgi:RHS repeat-associated protein